MTTKQRTYNEAQKKQFVEKVDQYDWGSVNSYSTFHNELQQIIDETFPATLEVENNQDVQTSNRFNDYYVNIGRIKQENIKEEAEGEKFTEDPLSLVENRSPGTPFLSFEPTNEDTVKHVISNLKINPELSPDVYGFSIELLQLISDKISGTIARLVNKSFEDCVFPEELKLAAILPSKKVSNVDHNYDDPSNYRPVSIVSVLSKVFESIVVFQLRKYFENNNLFSEEQHGHKNRRSTVSAILSLFEVAVYNMKKEQSVKFHIYDLSEAYDSVDHQILLKKLSRYGVREKPMKYLESYLTGRRQFVQIAGCRSETKYINVGIPQGYRLAPFLFAVYINDLPNSVSGSICTIMYVDDVAFITPYQETDLRIEEKVNEDVNMWLRRNLLQLEENQTQHLLVPYFKPTKIESVKFVGVVLSNDLSWSEYINYLVENKLKSGQQSIQDKAALNLSSGVLRDTYLNEFHIYFTKDILLWGHTEAANIIFEKQKELISILQPGEESIKSKFIHYNLLTVPSLYIRSCLLHAHISSQLNTKIDLEIYRTEPRYTLTFLYTALPEDIRELNRTDFHKKISRILIENAIFTIEEYLLYLGTQDTL